MGQIIPDPGTVSMPVDDFIHRDGMEIALGWQPYSY